MFSTFEEKVYVCLMFLFEQTFGQIIIPRADKKYSKNLSFAFDLNIWLVPVQFITEKI